MKFVIGPIEYQSGFPGLIFDFTSGYTPVPKTLGDSVHVSEISASNPLGTFTEESVVVGDYQIFGSLVYSRTGTAEKADDGLWHSDYTETLQVTDSTITKIVLDWPLGNGVSIYWDLAVVLDQVIGKFIDQFVTDGSVIYGSSASDTITTTSAAEIIDPVGAGNRIIAGAGADSIFGRRRDYIDAGPDDDFIFSGGFSHLTGGAGADHFVYQSALDLGRGRFAKEIITDFEVGVDIIDFSGMDAHHNMYGDQAFKFVGDHALSKRGGELHIGHRGHGDSANTIIHGNIDFDKRAEFMIVLNGDIKLSSTDFML